MLKPFITLLAKHTQKALSKHGGQLCSSSLNINHRLRNTLLKYGGRFLSDNELAELEVQLENSILKLKGERRRRRTESFKNASFNVANAAVNSVSNATSTAYQDLMNAANSTLEYIGVSSPVAALEKRHRMAKSARHKKNDDYDMEMEEGDSEDDESERDDVRQGLGSLHTHEDDMKQFGHLPLGIRSRKSKKARQTIF
eukprot:g1027.t1